MVTRLYKDVGTSFVSTLKPSGGTYSLNIRIGLKIGTFTGLLVVQSALLTLETKLDIRLIVLYL